MAELENQLKGMQKNGKSCNVKSNALSSCQKPLEGDLSDINAATAIPMRFLTCFARRLGVGLEDPSRPTSEAVPSGISRKETKALENEIEKITSKFTDAIERKGERGGSMDRHRALPCRALRSLPLVKGVRRSRDGPSLYRLRIDL